MITVAPVHCKYGKTSRFSDFYRLRWHMLLWDVSLAFPLLPFSSNCTENCYCANSYTIDTFAHTYYESEKGLNFFKAHTLKVLFFTAVFSTPLLTFLISRLESKFLRQQSIAEIGSITQLDDHWSFNSGLFWLADVIVNCMAYSQTRWSVPVANELKNSLTEKWFRLLIQ